MVRFSSENVALLLIVIPSQMVGMFTTFIIAIGLFSFSLIFFLLFLAEAFGMPGESP